MKVILISGKAQSGKDTVATLIREELTTKAKKVLITHYADLLKYICVNYFEWDGIKDERGRQMLQYIGTDVVRKKNPDLWVDFIAMMLNYFHKNWDYVIIPDCRFPNEISKMKDSGFDTVHIKVLRDNFVNKLTQNQKQHASETALDDIQPDYYIRNYSTLDDLKKITQQWIKECLYGDEA